MDLYALIDHCTINASPRMESVLHQLVVTTSQGDPWHIFDLTEQKTYEPRSSEQAQAMTQALLEAGHDLRVGLTWHDPIRTMEMGWSIAQSFEPCTALAITSELLGEITRTNQRVRLARYLDPSGGEALLGFVDQILSQPTIHIQLQVEQGKLWPGRVYTLSAQSGSGGVLVVPQSHVPSPVSTPPVLLPGHNSKQPKVQPAKWSENGIPVSSTEETSAQPQSTSPSSPLRIPAATSTPSPRRRAQPPVTKERLPLSTKPSQEETSP